MFYPLCLDPLPISLLSRLFLALMRANPTVVGANIRLINEYFIRRIPYPATAGSARSNAKKERTKKKQIGAEGEPSTPTQAIDARMGEEEKNRKQGRTKRNRERAPAQLPGPFGRFLRPAGIMRWAYSETPPPSWEYI